VGVKGVSGVIMPSPPACVAIARERACHRRSPSPGRPVRRSAIALVLAAGLSSGCAPAGRASAGSASVGGAAATSPAESDRITAAEIAAAELPTAYELVERLRRPWLRRQGPQGGQVVVYLDERQIGGAAVLRDHPAATVAELRYVTHEEAARRWGDGIPGGVIVIVPRR
jgi:hypothetical protein